MRFRKTKSRGARKSVRKTQRKRRHQHQHQRRTQHQRKHSSLQRGGGIADDNREIPDQSYVIGPGGALYQKKELKEDLENYDLTS